MSKITLRNVRISFPSIFQKETFNGQETKYAATFLLDKNEHADVIAQIKEDIEQRLKTDFKGKKLGADKLALRDGSLSGYDGYENCYSIKASNSKRPLVLNRDKTPLTEADGVIYSGARVNAIIELWNQMNEYGSRINANLLGVQFHSDDTPFASGASASVDDFDAFSDDSDPFA